MLVMNVGMNVGNELKFANLLEFACSLGLSHTKSILVIITPVPFLLSIVFLLFSSSAISLFRPFPPVYFLAPIHCPLFLYLI